MDVRCRGYFNPTDLISPTYLNKYVPLRSYYRSSDKVFAKKVKRTSRLRNATDCETLSMCRVFNSGF